MSLLHVHAFLLPSPCLGLSSGLVACSKRLGFKYRNLTEGDKQMGLDMSYEIRQVQRSSVHNREKRHSLQLHDKGSIFDLLFTGRHRLSPETSVSSHVIASEDPS